MFLRPLLLKTDEAGRFFIFPKKKMRPLLFLFHKINEAPFLFILKIKMCILIYIMYKINEATFLFKSAKKTDEGSLKQMMEGLRSIFYLALCTFICFN